MDAPCRIEMLGGLRVMQAERTITRFRSQKTGALLAYLALHPRRTHAREHLIDLLWPDDAPEAARRSLRVSLSSLRRQIEPPGTPAGSVFLADYQNVRLNPQAVVTDVAEFEALLPAAAREADPATRAGILSRAVALYAGELLPGHYEDWILAERERLGQSYVGALRQLSAAQAAAGDLDRAADAALRAVQADRYNEEAYGELMRFLVASGQPEAALRRYRELERLLEQEMGEAPSPARSPPGRSRIGRRPPPPPFPLPCRRAPSPFCSPTSKTPPPSGSAPARRFGRRWSATTPCCGSCSGSMAAGRSTKPETGFSSPSPPSMMRSPAPCPPSGRWQAKLGPRGWGRCGCAWPSTPAR